MSDREEAFGGSRNGGSKVVGDADPQALPGQSALPTGSTNRWEALTRKELNRRIGYPALIFARRRQHSRDHA